MKIGFAKGDLTGALKIPQVLPGEKPAKEVVFSPREKKLVELSDKFIIGMMNQQKGTPGKVVGPMELTAVYAEGGDSPWVILAFDLCYFTYEQIDSMREPLVKNLNLSPDRILILNTHAHAPCGIIAEKSREIILDTVKQAKANAEEMEAASLNLKVDASKLIVNRRVDVKGIGSRTVMFNTSCDIKENCIDATGQIWKWVEDLGVDPAKYLDRGDRYLTHGEIDDKLQGLFFRSKKTGKTTGSFVRFACHPVIVSGMWVKGEISADYPGHLKKRIEEKLGGVAVFGQGPSGDIKPLNPEYTHAFARKFGENLADKLIQEFPSLKWSPLNDVRFITGKVSLPLRKGFPESPAQAEEEINKIEKQYDTTSDPSERRKLQNASRFFGFAGNERHSLLRPDWRNNRQIEVDICAVKFNDTVLLASNGEVFTKTGKAMVEPFKENCIMTLSLANEYISYLVPSDEFVKGGYEAAVCLIDSQSLGNLVTGAHRLLKKVYK